MSDSEIAYYRGKRIEDMTREELIDAVKVLGRMATEAQKRVMSTHDFYRGLREKRIA